MKQPLLSVIIPVYNAQDSIKKIVAKVLDQSMRDLELILIVAGTTDKSLSIIKKMQKNDRRVKVISQKNGGASSARNTGIYHARGKYIMFLDADDDISQDMIPKMIAETNKRERQLVSCGIKVITVKNNKIISKIDIGVSAASKKTDEENFTNYIVRLLGIDGRLYNIYNKIYYSEIIKQNNIRFQEGLDFGEDLTFNLQYMKRVNIISFINEPLYYYNFDAENGTFGKSSLIYGNRAKNYAELLKFVGKNRDDETNDLLGWIKFYWFYSYVLAVNSAKITAREKTRLLRHGIKSEKLRAAHSGKFIGRKKYIIEKVIKLASVSSITLLLFALVTGSMKRNRFMAKFWQKFKVSSMS